MSKQRVKQLIWMILIFSSMASIVLVLIGLGRLVLHVSSGADPATALNLVPDVPVDLDDRLTWRPDHPDTTSLRPLEPPTRRQIEGAYLRAWAQLDISYAVDQPHGLRTYFTGPALDALSNTLSETVDNGWVVDRSSVAHELELTFYSDDGSVVTFTDHKHRLVQRLRHAEANVDEVIDETGRYEVLMLLEDGNWRIRDWKHVGEGDVPTLPLAADPLPGMVSAHGTELRLNGESFLAAGVNYYPSAASWNEFWPTYDPERTTRDLAQARALGLNTLRIFIPFFEPAHAAAPERPQDGAALSAEMLMPKLTDLLDQAAQQDMRVVVTLFDHRTDHHPSAWATDARYVATIVAPLAEHPAILAWDLKNEADLDLALNGQALLDAWLLHVVRTLREHDPHHLITVGWFSPESAASAQLTPMTDLVSYHYWDDPVDYMRRVEALRAAVPDKPLLLQEFTYATWSPLRPARQTESQQARYFRTLLQAHRATDAAGYLAWTLYDFERADLSQFRTPQQRARQRNMGVIRRDGTLKPAAALLNPEADLFTMRTQAR